MRNGRFDGVPMLIITPDKSKYVHWHAIILAAPDSHPVSAPSVPEFNYTGYPSHTYLAPARFTSVSDGEGCSIVGCIASWHWNYRTGIKQCR